jgi:PAS domain S-box-containing protein
MEHNRSSPLNPVDSATGAPNTEFEHSRRPKQVALPRGDFRDFVAMARAFEKRYPAKDELSRSKAYLIEAQRLSHTGSLGWHVPSGRVFWSDETFRIFGYDEEVKPTIELVLQRVHPEDRAYVQRTIDLAPRTGSDIDLEHRLVMPDGSTKFLHVVAKSSRNDTGDELEYIGAVTDITATRKAELQLRHSEQNLRLTLETLPGMVWTMLPDGTVDFCNEAILKYCGKTFDELRADLTCVWHPDEIESKVHKLRGFLSAGTPNEDEFRLLRHDGVYRWYQCRVQPLRDESGEIIRWYGLLWDIHERKHAEEERREAFEEIQKLRDQLYQENLALREEIDQTSMFEEIVGCSAMLREVLAQVAKVAPTDSTVLIGGETGTGKELIARAIHNHSRRSKHPFVSVNCAAIPQSLIASELFGYEKGAFTGATQRRLGRFELATGGTIFLDEVGDLPPETQVALLRVLQEREIERIGGSRPISIDVRVVAATNRCIPDLVEAGSFRHDLWYRLNVVPIGIPPLRDRPDDIPLLVDYLVDRYAKKTGKPSLRINKKTMTLLQNYDWPGNVRELQNVIERAVVLSTDDILRVDERWFQQPVHARSGPETPRALRPVPDEVLKPVGAKRQKEIIEAALAKCGGRIAGPRGAAVMLGIPRQTLDSKIASLGIDKKQSKSS